MPETSEIVRLYTESPENSQATPTSSTTDPVASLPDSQRWPSVRVKLECSIDLRLLRKQKHMLFGITAGSTVTFEQEDVAEGILNLLDFIQDSILEQGLATEEEIFPKLPQLFESEPAKFDTAA